MPDDATATTTRPCVRTVLSNNNPTLCAHGAQQATVEKGFASATKAIDKKCTAVNNGHDIVIDSSLLRVTLRHVLISHGCLHCSVIPGNFVCHHSTHRLGRRRWQAKCY
jgi:hypothetical protein